MSAFDSYRLALVLIASIDAIYNDIRYLQIPNRVSAFLVVGGLILQLVFKGREGIGQAFVGGLIGFCIPLIFYIFDQLGGGDLKLFGAFGFLLGGIWPVLRFLQFTTLVGGLIVLIFLVNQAIFRFPSQKSLLIPYAPAICVGALLTLLGKKIF